MAYRIGDAGDPDNHGMRFYWSVSVTDYSELKRLAETATNARWHEDDLGDALEFAPLDGEDQAFILAASPAVVFELIDEVEALRGLLTECRLMTLVVNSGQSGVLRGMIDTAMSQGKQP